MQQKSENKIMEVITRANQAPYQSKENGRNQISLSLPTSNKEKSIA
jgi:PleD family two-component response regulator